MKILALAAVAAALVSVTLPVTSAEAATEIVTSVSPIGPKTDVRTGTNPSAVRMQAQEFSVYAGLPWLCIDPFTTAVFNTSLTFTKVTLGDFVSSGAVTFSVGQALASYVNQAHDGTLTWDQAAALSYRTMGGPLDFGHAPTLNFYSSAITAYSVDPKYRAFDNIFVMIAPKGENGAPLTQTLIGKLPSTPAVPEPATWAMLIVGFGTVGLVARRRRPTIAVTA